MSDPKPAATPKARRTKKAKPAGDPFVQDRQAILAAALVNVPFDGWSLKTMREGAQAAGIAHERMRMLFPNGVSDLVDFFCAQGDARMVEILAKTDLKAMKVRERITHCVRVRIEMDGDHKEAARRAAAFLALPLYASVAVRVLYRTVDAIWRAAGDQSTDFNFYSKRAILAGVYSSTLLYWFGDAAEGNAQTWAFLDRRIKDVMQIEKVKAGVQKFGEMLPDPLSLLGRLRYGRGS